MLWLALLIKHMKKNNFWKSPYLITIIALLLMVTHVIGRYNEINLLDNIVLGLLIAALIPWLFTILQKAELPGGWVLEFKQIKEEQEEQKSNLKIINEFLIENFLTEFELNHLKKIYYGEEFKIMFDQTSHSFEEELRRLRKIKLINNKPNKGIRTLLLNDGKLRDVKDHFYITEKGKQFLHLVK
jgi:hypothetical protein